MGGGRGVSNSFVGFRENIYLEWEKDKIWLDKGRWKVELLIKN